jgi:hypothetical protein
MPCKARGVILYTSDKRLGTAFQFFRHLAALLELFVSSSSSPAAMPLAQEEKKRKKDGRPRAVVTLYWPRAALAGVHHGEAAWKNSSGSFGDPRQLCVDLPATWRSTISFRIVPCPLIP